MIRSILYALSLALLSACSIAGSGGSGGSGGKADIDDDDRGALGPARPYRGDETLTSREAELRGDMRTRREIAWERIATILQPVEIPGCPDSAERPEICEQADLGEVALWQTWYDRRESQEMARYLEDQGLAPTDENIDRAFAWKANEQIEDERAWGRYVDYLEDLQQQGGTPGDFEGFLGIRSAYSPQLIRHALKNADQLRRCSGRSESGVPTDTLSEENFAPCLTAEFPFDAAVIKAQWERVESDDTPVRVYDTSGSGLARRFNRAENSRMSWETPDGTAQPTENEIYTITDDRGVRYRLTSLHLTTKELRHWMWITLWWSPDAGDDFGADRPDSITGVWENYKMCVAVGYDEEDRRDPSVVYGDLPSLAAAIDTSNAAYDPRQLAEGELPPTWCSNPFLEFPAEAAPTNCIGCHQNSGTGRRDADILDADNLHGRKQERDTFLFDYMFSARELVEP